MERKFMRGMLGATVSGALLLSAGAASAQVEGAGHPGPQPWPTGAVQTLSEDGKVTYLRGGDGIFPEQDPWLPPEGSNTLQPTNLLETIYENAFDSMGREIPNTVPSTPENPYNLHPDPVITPVDKTSPSNDLLAIFAEFEQTANEGGQLDPERVQFALDILEGNPIDRTYSGFPLLMYKGGEKEKVVEPEFDADGNVIGGNVNVHQLWMHQHIMSDTAFIDPTMVQDVPWTITYTVDVLDRGKEDFAPHAMLWDLFNNDEGEVQTRPGWGIDQTFFPVEEGYRHVFEIEMPPARYWKLTYHWGWRIHPPRVQVIENSLQNVMGMYLPDWESYVFGENPSASEEAKLNAIGMIGDLAPAKRMWNAFRTMQSRQNADAASLRNEIEEARNAFFDWTNRNYLPAGVEPDPDADITLLYANNQIYGEVKGYTRDTHDMQRAIDDWRTRGHKIKVTIKNADYYPRAYVAVDFGGMRGWENTFQNTIPVGGQGPWFTFGRTHWWPNTVNPVSIAAAERLPAQVSSNPVAAARAQLVAGGDAPEDQGPIAAARARLLAGETGLPEAATSRERASNGARVVSEDWLQRPSRENTPAVERNAQGLSTHSVHIEFNHEPSTRLRLYQFDPLHHDVAVWSLH